jgi:hypothetical protein
MTLGLGPLVGDWVLRYLPSWMGLMPSLIPWEEKRVSSSAMWRYNERHHLQTRTKKQFLSRQEIWQCLDLWLPLSTTSHIQGKCALSLSHISSPCLLILKKTPTFNFMLLLFLLLHLYFFLNSSCFFFLL